jgi:hypothetical protein
MHSDKIYAFFCGQNRNAERKTIDKNSKLQEKWPFLGKLTLFDGKQCLQKRSKTNKTGLDKIDKIF